MRQKRFGKKIQNWHRPLGPSQLRRRFRRHRYDHAGLAKPEEDPRYAVEVDDYWNCYDPRGGYRCGHDNELFSHHLDHLWHAIASPLPPHIDIEWPSDGRADGKPEDPRLPAAPDQTIRPGLEERLGAYIEKLVRLSAKDSLALRYHIAEAIGDFHNLEVVKEEYSWAPEAAKRICLFAPFWRRSPETWSRECGTPLLDHLFVLYPVPRFLCPEWFRDLYPGWGAYYAEDEVERVEQGMPRFKWLCWFILLGQGGSLRRAADLFDWRIPARFQYGLQDAPSDASPVEACVFAEVKRLGGSELDCGRILRNPAFVIDPTELSAVESYWAFWQDTVRWLVAHRDAITDEQSNQILSWAMHMYTEAAQQGTQPFTWKGRRVRAVLERSIEYARQISCPMSHYAWQPHGWDWVLEDKPHGRWTFCELTSGKELSREGMAMHHCVASYAGRCASGHSAIVSVAHNDIRRVTVEINPRTRQIVQATGACNRSVNQEEQRAIHLWMKAVLQPDTPEQTG